MEEMFAQEIEQIKGVYFKLIETTNDSIANELYNKCISVFEKYKETKNVNNFYNFREVVDAIAVFRLYLSTYYNKKGSIENLNDKILSLNNNNGNAA